MRLLSYAFIFFLTSKILAHKEQYGRELFLMSDDTLILQANTQIYEVDHLEVSCDNNIKGNYKLEEFASIHNDHLNFRINLGKTTKKEITCNVKVGKNTATITSNIKDNIQVNVLESEMQTYEVEEIQDSSSDYNWTDEELSSDTRYEEVNVNVNKETQISKRYTKLLEKGIKHRNVYISMTTTPERLSKIHYAVHNLDLTYVTNVLIILPKLYKNEERYTIPRKLIEKFPKVKLISVSQDIGPIAKIAAAVEYVKQIRPKLYLSDVFISINDDIAYANSMVSTNIFQTLADGGVSIISHGKMDEEFCKLSGVFKPEYQINKRNKEPENTLTYERVLTSNSSMVYRGRLLDVNLTKLLNRKRAIDNPCYYTEDLVVSFIAAFQNTQLLYHSEDNCSNEVFCSKKTDKYHHYYDREGLTMRNEMSCYNFNRCYEFLVRHFVDFSSHNLEYLDKKQLIRDKVKRYRKSEL